MSRTIFDLSQAGRAAAAQYRESANLCDLPATCLRSDPLLLPEVSELQAVRHYTKLSSKNLAVDNAFYPLGSCTMKYNPRGAHKAANLPGFLARHPLAPNEASQGTLSVLFELQEWLKVVTGMSAISLAPMAGAQGELAGILMIRAYHQSRGDHRRIDILVPSAAHGTNPATASMCGFRVREITVGEDGDVDIDDLKRALGPSTAGMMLTNPSTCGVFERSIEQIDALVHEAGGLLYYDGANLNAILGKVRPGDMGFDVLHLNTHKTFATPHGGGGPGAGPVGVNERLEPFLPVPTVGKNDEGYEWLGENHVPHTIGRLSAFMGNAGILIRAHAYARLLGREGLQRVSEYAVLNANYLQTRLQKAGFQLAYPTRRAGHEFIVTLKREAKELGVPAIDFAKRLLDFGIHAPTTYFPLIIPECLLIEPTETESKQELDTFVNTMVEIREEARRDPDFLHGAPYLQPVRRLNDVKAAREPNLVWRA